MRADDLLPPPGETGHAPLDVFPAEGGDTRLSGIFVQRDGQLMIAAGGHGLGVRLDATAAGGLALVLLAMAQHLEAEGRQAAAEAAADADALLARVMQ
jgi:hypothetical protein